MLAGIRWNAKQVSNDDRVILTHIYSRAQRERKTCTHGPIHELRKETETFAYVCRLRCRKMKTIARVQAPKKTTAAATAQLPKSKTILVDRNTPCSLYVAHSAPVSMKVQMCVGIVLCVCVCQKSCTFLFRGDPVPHSAQTLLRFASGGVLVIRF